MSLGRGRCTMRKSVLPKAGRTGHVRARPRPRPRGSWPEGATGLRAEPGAAEKPQGDVRGGQGWRLEGSARWLSGTHCGSRPDELREGGGRPGGGHYGGSDRSRAGKARGRWSEQTHVCRRGPHGPDLSLGVDPGGHEGRIVPPGHSESQAGDGRLRDRQDLVLLVRPASCGWTPQGHPLGGAAPAACASGAARCPPTPRTRTSLSCSVLDSCICFSIWDLCSIIRVFSYVNAEMSFST